MPIRATSTCASKRFMVTRRQRQWRRQRPLRRRQRRRQRQRQRRQRRSPAGRGAAHGPPSAPPRRARAPASEGGATRTDAAGTLPGTVAPRRRGAPFGARREARGPAQRLSAPRPTLPSLAPLAYACAVAPKAARREAAGGQLAPSLSAPPLVGPSTPPSFPPHSIPSGLSPSQHPSLLPV